MTTLEDGDSVPISDLASPGRKEPLLRDSGADASSAETHRLLAATEKRSYRRFVILGVILAALCILGAVGLLLRYRELDDTSAAPPVKPVMQCTHPIYCVGKLLETVQLFNPPLFNDSKTFVDMPCLSTPQEILDAFSTLPAAPDYATMRSFLTQHFAPAGSEVMVVQPADFSPSPPRLTGVRDPELRQYALDVNAVWRNLTRAFDTNFSCGAECLSSLPLPKPFVVPGGRFREFYYWDTFWIVKGLLVSGMTTTARNVLENLFFMVDTYGFVPNGARVYYMDRSQPPLLTQMVAAFAAETGDSSIIVEALPRLFAEHDFWMQTGHLATWPNMPDDVTLNRYFVDTSDPRPESYREDIQTLAQIPGRSARSLFSDLAAGAETGWDYSSRWFNLNYPELLGTVMTTDVVPVDLNAILLQNEIILSNWTCGATAVATNDDRCSMFTNYAAQRRRGMQAYLRSGSIIHDMDLRLQQPRAANWYASMSLPLSIPSFVGDMSSDEVAAAVESLLAHVYVGGVPASNVSNTQQQWDFPNAWAPLQYFAIQALELIAKTTGTPSYSASALAIAQSWITTSYCGYQATGALFEKYNASSVGVAGHGGEYTVQAGFGWTNGLILWLLETYGGSLTAPIHC